MTSDPFSPLLERARAHALAYLADQPDRHVGARGTRVELDAALRIPLPAQGEDSAAVIDLLAAQAAQGVVVSGSPRYFGFVIGGTHPVALAADWLSSAWDQNAGIHATSPLSAVVEAVAADWILELFDLPHESAVGFVTGCQMANFTCLAAARHAVLRRVGWDVEADGLQGAPRIHVVTSAESHVTIDVALRYLGIGTRALHRVPSDAQGRMRADSLRELVATLEGPIIVCAQAGNVNTGSFDPLRRIAETCAAHGAWLHVDGAFGLWARASRSRAALADGIELADSWATDAHKWLNVPYDCGFAIVRHADDHRAAMTSAAAYLIQTKGEERDAVDWVPEFSRRARGIPVYATLRALGRNGVEKLVDNCCERASQMARLLAAHAGVQVLNEVVLNQVLARFSDDDEMTRAVIKGVQDEGTCWLSGTTWHGQAAMRISVSNRATSEEDAARSASAILRVFDSLSEPDWRSRPGQAVDV
ncbi:MAG TPA: aminotransferase class V-fold PLP-dependent enzyme [Dokdonella sp.]|uniref:pyridoxal phosphate-dependent decarboxylase family protein n=1 Tax=Dokdonella sp. TaxID=2291710 RepID=UPI002B81ECFA|nr:pyridoxal-dependent decarboxylase [Dokdonella sp.]HPG94663.1 aminotransferase class V-fold PLP-dependent enzyme [Dokdonella sp.]HPN79191.1 aminotransferase class V-fold PLP-dependent enzyme [Dokdonella sp.]